MPSSIVAAARLVRVRRLVGARADTVADRVRRLAREADRVDPGADAPVELRQARARARTSAPPRRRRRAALLELAVAVASDRPDEVLRVVAPVAVGADPDLEQRRLALDDGPVGGRRERPDPGARPDEREAERELDLALPSRCPRRGRSRATRRQPAPRSSRAGSRPARAPSRPRDVVREAHPLDLLRRLQHPRLVEQRRRVLRVRERVEPRLREGRRLADHAVGRLRAERELDARPPRTARASAAARSSARSDGGRGSRSS